MFILDSGKYAKDPSGVSGQIAGLVEKHGGEVIVSRLWEERKLAYPINGQKKGTYWLTYFHLDSGKVNGLNRDCELNENFLRQLFLCPDPRVTETLVRVAQGKAAAPAADAPAEA
jgi:small subunit ribosomal protein S6